MLDNCDDNLRQNKISFYDVFHEVRKEPTNKNLATALAKLRTYFSQEDRDSLTLPKLSALYNIIEFDSKDLRNQYLSWVLTIFFRNATAPGLAQALLQYLQNPWLELGDDALTSLARELEEANEYVTLVANTSLKMQILIKQNFSGDALLAFKPWFKQEFSIAVGSKRKLDDFYDESTNSTSYNTSYPLHVEEVKYVALGQIAKDKGLSPYLEEAADSCYINDIDLRAGKSYKQSSNYFSFEENQRKALEALYVAAIDGKPAFLTCSDNGHWATLGLLVVNKELHIFKFDSMGSSLADQAAKELAEIAGKQTNFLTKVHPLHDLSLYVQDSQNCGAAAAGFIAEFYKIASQGTSIEELKASFGPSYKKNIIGTESNRGKQTQEFISNIFAHIKPHERNLRNGNIHAHLPEQLPEAGSNAAHHSADKPLDDSLSSLSNSQLVAPYTFNYDASRLYSFLDLSNQRLDLFNKFKSKYKSKTENPVFQETWGFVSVPLLTIASAATAFSAIYFGLISSTIIATTITLTLAVVAYLVSPSYVAIKCIFSDVPLKEAAAAYVLNELEAANDPDAAFESIRDRILSKDLKEIITPKSNQSGNREHSMPTAPVPPLP